MKASSSTGDIPQEEHINSLYGANPGQPRHERGTWEGLEDGKERKKCNYIINLRKEGTLDREKMI